MALTVGLLVLVLVLAGQPACYARDWVERAIRAANPFLAEGTLSDEVDWVKR